MSALFQPLQAGALLLPNRILMAPLTRCRASADNVPGDLMATHYAQRASAGLLIAEATMAKPGNVGFLSQSGALCTAVLDWSLKEDVGFSAFVSLGFAIVEP